MKNKILMALLGLGLLWFVWSRFIGPIAGDPEELAAAERAVTEAESALETARSQGDTSASAIYEQGDRFLAELATLLPAISIDDNNAVLHWYERTLFTPSELKEYAENSAELVEFAKPSLWSNNETCYPEGITGDISLSACQEFGSPTIILAQTPVKISLEGWRLDCRAALGWVFSRFFLNDSGDTGPQGRYLQPWIVPGTFSASPLNCVSPREMEILHRHIGVASEEWPIPEEDADAYFANLDAAPTGELTHTQLAMTVSFNMLYLPVSRDLCVRDVAGFGMSDADNEAADDQLDFGGCWGNIRMNELLNETADKSYETRICIPRIPLATVVEDGDSLLASLFENAFPAAERPWPNDLDNCHLPMLSRQVAPEDTEDAEETPETGPPEVDLTLTLIAVTCPTPSVETLPPPHEPGYPHGHAHPHDPSERVILDPTTVDNLAPDLLLPNDGRCMS